MPASHALFFTGELTAVHIPDLESAESRGMALLPPGIAAMESRRAAYAEAVTAREHRTLMLNLAAAGALALLGMLIFAAVLRRPLTAILNAISDIERGVPPPKWAFGGPTELRTIGTALAELGRQLQNSTRERELMLASLTHDLRSPLARVQAALELRMDQVDDPQLSDSLQEVNEIARIISQCADYARDGRDEPLVIESLDRVVAGALQGQSDVTMELAAAAPFPIRALAVARAVRNLVENARRHGELPISVTTSLQGEWAELRVEDGGAGISIDDWPVLTQPFTQSGPARSRGGSGLGLAIALRVALAHAGELRMRARDAHQPFGVILRFARVPRATHGG